MHRVILDAEHELSRFDLGEIQNVVDEPKQVLAVLLHSVQHLFRFRREFAVQPVLHELGIAEDGIERCAEFMAHVGQELRFVLARQFELPGLIFDLLEEARVLDGERGLRCKRLHQFNDRLSECTRVFDAEP